MAAVDKQIKAWLVQNKHEIAKNLECVCLVTIVMMDCVDCVSRGLLCVG